PGPGDGRVRRGRTRGGPRDIGGRPPRAAAAALRRTIGDARGQPGRDPAATRHTAAFTPSGGGAAHDDQDGADAELLHVAATDPTHQDQEEAEERQEEDRVARPTEVRWEWFRSGRGACRPLPASVVRRGRGRRRGGRRPRRGGA